MWRKSKDYFFNRKFLNYITSSHFWGPVSNFGIPIAAFADLKKDPEVISGPMTSSLIIYSLIFMRYSTQVRPKNYLLFCCHLLNEVAQIGQGYRFLQYHYRWFGGNTIYGPLEDEKAPVASIADAHPAIEGKK